MNKMQVAFFFLALLAPCICFSWGGERKVAIPAANTYASAGDTHSGPLQQPSRVPDIYAIALSELQELESEPLCHRVAARLLVNNCQLVDGKSDATILTDSGRQVRDFVDSYAASLAICDLERGSFAIPKDCAKFREPSLSQIALRNEAFLHVSPKEIGRCLSALAASDAAWSTWISYRHKALRFCEAARADNEKGLSILFYQRLTRVISKLTEGVEVELQRRMQDLDNQARQYLDTLEQLAPYMDHLHDGLRKMESYIQGNLDMTLKKSADSANDSLQQVENLQQMLRVLLSNVLENNSQMATVHEQSLQVASKRASDDIGGLVAIIAMAATSSNSLQQQIEISNQQAAELSRRQDTLEQGMDRLLVATEALSTKYEDQAYVLMQANNLTNDILDSLEDTATAAALVSNSFLSNSTSGSWWPFVVFPSASLIMGSYGLPPSMLRNFGLLALGEMVGILVSFHEQVVDGIHLYAPTISANATASSL
ncbi:hypothetical protein B0T24DRAFT_74671 [Lasiosphaeria ovina]|uniref:Nuclear membrane fusion protein Kar5 n=1 Tax=Lasiosphaeria ovina TaxID=92902 RepID=A0AAE0NMQ4_9PEZI|nr:hypothetical protein B0T24DRAFT_74671 [Lasiosphaeria ovina]